MCLKFQCLLDLRVRDETAEDQNVTELLTGATRGGGIYNRLTTCGDRNGTSCGFHCTLRLGVWTRSGRCADHIAAICNGALGRDRRIDNRIGFSLLVAPELHSDAPPVAWRVPEFMGTSVTAENLRTDHPNPTATQFTLLATGDGASRRGRGAQPMTRVAPVWHRRTL